MTTCKNIADLRFSEVKIVHNPPTRRYPLGPYFVMAKAEGGDWCQFSADDTGHKGKYGPIRYDFENTPFTKEEAESCYCDLIKTIKKTE